jgi:hypothetical protein
MIGVGTAGGGAEHEAFPRGPAKGQEPPTNDSLQTAQLSLPRKCHVHNGQGFDTIRDCISKSEIDKNGRC